MKQMKRLLIAALLLSCVMYAHAQNPKREFRATWVTTHYSIDWPTTKATSAANIAKQKAELTAILDKLAAANMNAFTFHVRALGDAMFISSYEPWSKQLTGTRGKDPGYDPLAFAIEEGHKRGLEIHAWFNPFRYESSAGSHGTNDPIRKNHPEWLLEYDNGSFAGTIFDPGLPEVREYTVKVIQEVVEKYDIDGVIFDDYFYPYGGTTTEDKASKAQYKPAGQSDDDWRRENIDKTMEAVYDMIQEKKPWVRFGIAPFGIWTTDKSAAAKYGISLPSGITGMNAYKTLACNTISWMQGGYVDYIAPQIYWSTTSSGQDYDVLSQWWSQMASHFSARLENGKKVHFFSANNDYSDWVTTREMGLEVEANRRYDALGGTGAIFYNTNMFFTNNLHTYFPQNQFSTRALVPAMDWKETEILAAPTDLKLNGTTLTWNHATAPRFSVYAFTKGSDKVAALSVADYLLGVTYTNSFDVSEIVDLTNTTFAVCAYDRYGNEYEAALYNEGEYTPPVEKPLPEGKVKITKLWSHTIANTDWTFSTGNNHRSVSYYDGKLYLPHKEAGEIYVINATTGKKEKTLTTSADFYLHNVRVTADGQMLYGNTGSGSSSIEVFSSSITAGGSTEIGSSSIAGRCDYFYPYGKWNEKGFLLALSNTGNITKIPFANGALQTEVQVSNASLPAGTSAKVVPASDGTSCYTSATKKIPSKHHITTGKLLESFGTVRPATVEVSGVAVFMVNEHKYMVTPADVFGGFEVFDISRGLSKATKVIEATEALGKSNNAAFTVDFAVDVQGNDAYIYVLAPNNGLAAYKFTFTPNQPTDIMNIVPTEVQLVPTHEGVMVNFSGTKRVSIYTVNGILLQSQMAIEMLTCPLMAGMYIIQVGNETLKFVK